MTVVKANHNRSMTKREHKTIAAREGDYNRRSSCDDNVVLDHEGGECQQKDCVPNM